MHLNERSEPQQRLDETQIQMFEHKNQVQSTCQQVAAQHHARLCMVTGIARNRIRAATLFSNFLVEPSEETAYCITHFVTTTYTAFA